MLERLVLRPELGAFEAGLRERLDRLAALEDERIARPRSLERELSGLAVVTEFVPGSRLSDLLERSAQLGHVPGMDAALGFLLDVLPALCGLHNGVGFAHGTIAPSRTVLTPAGQIVLLDSIYGEALTRLRHGRRKLWQDFGVAAPDNVQGTPRLDAAADITQAALAAVMLVLGRPLQTDEYISGLSGVVAEVVEVAQIRGTAAFAQGVEEFLQRALALDAAPRYASTDDVLFEVRQLASELGVQVCRRALVDFIEQMESPQLPQEAGGDDDLADAIESYGLDGDDLPEAEQPEADQEDQPRLADGADAELNLDELVEEDTYELDAPPAIEVYDVPPSGGVDDEPVDWIQLAAASRAETSREYDALLQPVIGPSAGDYEAAAASPVAPPPLPVAAETAAVDEGVAAATPSEHEAAQAASEEPLENDEITEPETTEEDTPESAAPDAPELDAVEAPSVQAEALVPAVRARRAKRVTRSARARKDKLRSVSESGVRAIVPGTPAPAAAAAAPPPPPDVKKPEAPTWLVSPDRAAAFEPAVPIIPVFGGADPQSSPVAAPLPIAVLTPPPAPALPAPFPTPAPVPIYVAPPPPVSVYTPPAPAATALQVDPFFTRTVGTVAPSYSTPPSWTPPPVSSIPDDPASQLTTAKLKDLPRTRGARPEAVSDIYVPAAAAPAAAEPTAFPWKLAAAAAVIMVVAIVGGRVYLPAKGAPSGDGADAPTSSMTVSAPAVAAPAPAAPPRGGSATAIPNAGRLEIETQPAGARILIDGKPAGESPIALDGVTAGRHTVTFLSSSGSVKRTVRIEAGRTAKLDVPIFSGWVGIYAPFVVEVVEGGRVIGTTEQPRIMLSPGRHDLTLVNRDLGYSSAQSVDVEPGEVRTVSIDPRGLVNLNATPWAEVWVDGRKAGDTPLANLPLTLGVREITFRHPQLGERKVTVTVKGNAPTAVSIDMTKP